MLLASLFIAIVHISDDLIVSVGANPIQISRGILIKRVKTDGYLNMQVEEHELADVAAVSAGNDYAVGNLILDALRKVGWRGI